MSLPRSVMSGAMATDPNLLPDPASNQEAPPPSKKLRVLSEVDDAGVMSTRCRLALQKTRQDFVRDLDVMPTLDCLFSKLVFTEEDCQAVRGKSTDSERRRGLLDILQERGQRAYHELCEHLRKDQTWLLAVLQKNYDSITESELFGAAQQYQGQSEGSSELEESLRENLKDKLREWKTALEEGCPGQDEHLDYIDQPCTFTTEGSDSPSPPELSSSTIKVVKDSEPGDRIQIFGEAGMGKTTLLKQLTSSWIDRSNSHLATKFKYVFLIPMRLVGSSSLLGILCDELGLLPKSSEADLEKSLRLNERKVLFLLDSYEECPEDAKMDEIEIGDLLTGKLFPKSTVIVTSRPGSGLPRSEHQKTVKLNDLPEDKVIGKIKHLFGENEAAGDEVIKSFPAMSFLQRPINLALFLFVVRNDKGFKLQESFSQVELFNQILQYLMLAYAKKRQFSKFTPQPGSYLNNSGIPRDIRRLFRDIAKKCFEEREENDLILHIPDDGDLEDYLYFGLFVAGPDAKSVVVPHRLFKEYFAAAHLAEDPSARSLLFEKIKLKLKSETRSRQESQTGRFQSSIISPIDVVQQMGLENVLRFVVSLAPQVCQEIGSLFVLERANDDLNYHLVNLEFYVTLLGECSDENGKHALATALVNVPVRDVEDFREDSRSYCSGLLAFVPYLNYDQCLVLLKKAFKLDVHEKNGKLAISCASDTLTITDAFVITFIFINEVIITNDKVRIVGSLLQPLLVPAPLLSRHMQGVRELQLWMCFIVDVPVNWRSLLIRKNSSLRMLVLSNIAGLENCDVITSCQCGLVMINCGKVTVSSLRTCFPKLSKLKLSATSIVYSSEEELTSWLSTIQSVESVHVSPQHEGEPLCLNHFLNMNLFSERRELIDVQFSNYRLLQNVPEATPVNPHNTLKRMELNACKDVDLGKLLEVCSQCRQLKKLAVMRCQLLVNVKDMSDKVQQTCNKLDELFIRESEGILDLGQLLELLSRLRHPNELWLDAVDLTLDDRNVESLKKLPELQKFVLVSGEMVFFDTCVQTPSGRKIWQEELEQHLSRLCPSARIRIGAPSSLIGFSSEDEDLDSFRAQLRRLCTNAEFPDDKLTADLPQDGSSKT